MQRLEEGMALQAGRKFGIAVTNGSAALDVAVAALGLGPGDEVILPTFTIISCAASIVRAGATPVVVDCDADTWNMAAEDVVEKITARTRAIMVVHIYGLPADMDPIVTSGRETWTENNRRRSGDARSDIQRQAMREFRGYQYLQLLPQQARYDRRRRHGIDRRSCISQEVSVPTKFMFSKEAVCARGTGLELSHVQSPGRTWRISIRAS